MLELEELKQTFVVDDCIGEVFWRRNVGQRGVAGEVAGTRKLTGKMRYLGVVYKGRRIPKHKLIWILHNNKIPIGNIDHIDGDRLNNRPENLRCATQAENNRNAKNRKDNKSGIRGVCWNKSKNRWIVQIGVAGKVKQVGSFLDFFEACCVRKSAERLYQYHENHGRA